MVQTVVSGQQPVGLSELTLDELRDGIARARAECPPGDARVWILLVDLAEEMAASNSDDSLVSGHHWCLDRLSVTGFRGVGTTTEVEFDHAPGIIVIHGENGSGKSSLTEALRMALEGQVGLTHLGEKGRTHELWGSQDDRAQGTATALVAVTFHDASAPDTRLELRAEYDGTRVARTATLQSGDTTKRFDTSSPAWLQWNAAIRTSPPVFAYAELANELQKRNDLQTWLTACLAMDAAARHFNAAVTAQQSAARDARTRLERAQTSAAAKITDIDATASAGGVINVTPIQWQLPADSTARDIWLQENDLAERTRRDLRLTRGLPEELAEYCSEYARLKAAWTAATVGSLTPEVAAAVGELDTHVSHSAQTDNGGVCPVCGEASRSWREHLHSQAILLAAAMAASESLRRHLRARATRLVGPVRDCVAVLLDDYADQASITQAQGLLTDAEACAQLTDDLDHRVIKAGGELCAWLQSDAARRLVSAAVAVADARHDWLCARWDALTPYLELWGHEHELAALADDWKTALSRWNSHLSKLRKARSATLHELVSPAVGALLGDVGISLDVLDINKGDVKLVLRDRNGGNVELSHLSAGQRNALILGPVLGTAGGGLFNFCLLDDPVHAFDEFRVDQLAGTLAQMGEHQTLVVTTHDGRFVEYLRVHARDNFRVYIARRDDVGCVNLFVTESPSQVVLEYARQLTDAASARLGPQGFADIRALLRMAADEALEIPARRYLFTLAAKERGERSSQFASAMSLKDRMKWLRKELTCSSDQLRQLEGAYGHISSYVKSWSSATHAVGGTTPELVGEIDAAVLACGLFEAIRW